MSLPRGIPAASLKQRGSLPGPVPRRRLPRGIPAASLKHEDHADEAGRLHGGLPRGIPAASLKHSQTGCGGQQADVSSAGNTRGLIEAPHPCCCTRSNRRSSAGNTRGLIEASGRHRCAPWRPGLPRGIPAASLKPRNRGERRPGRYGLPRGIPAASLKRRMPVHEGRCTLRVFRGEYPRPH